MTLEHGLRPSWWARYYGNLHEWSVLHCVVTYRSVDTNRLGEDSEKEGKERQDESGNRDLAVVSF